MTESLLLCLNYYIIIRCGKFYIKHISDLFDVFMFVYVYVVLTCETKFGMHPTNSLPLHVSTAILMQNI